MPNETNDASLSLSHLSLGDNQYGTFFPTTVVYTTYTANLFPAYANHLLCLLGLTFLFVRDDH
jgi:hypothetical protein